MFIKSISCLIFFLLGTVFAGPGNSTIGSETQNFSKNSDTIANELENCLEGQKNFTIVTVTRDFILATDKTSHETQDTIYGAEITDLLNEISNKITETSKPVFIIFNEYFFSTKTLEYDKYTEIIQQISNKFKNQKNLIIYANFLYKLEDKVDNSVKGEKDYNPSLGIKFFRDPENVLQRVHPYDIDITQSQNKTALSGSFTNETSVIYKGEVISKYRKCTYCYEDNALLVDSYNYIYGDGSTSIEESNYKNIAKILNKYVCIDICFDIQQHIRYRFHLIKNDKLKATSDEIKAPNSEDNYENEKIASLKAKIPDNYPSPSSFKLRIIQSNTTNIHSVSDVFLNIGQIVVQSDPLAQMVFKIMETESNKNPTNEHPLSKLANQKLQTSLSQCLEHINKTTFTFTRNDINYKINLFNIGIKK